MDENDDEGDMVAMTTKSTYNSVLKYYEVALDNASQVNVIHPRFLTNVRKGKGSFSGLNSNNKSKATSLVGDLRDFYKCIACEDVRVSILSMADVEDVYDVTYVPKEKIHCPHGRM